MNASGYSLTFRGTVVFKHEIARVWSITDRLTTAVDGGIVKTMTVCTEAHPIIRCNLNTIIDKGIKAARICSKTLITSFLVTIQISNSIALRNLEYDYASLLYCHIINIHL